MRRWAVIHKLEIPLAGLSTGMFVVCFVPCLGRLVWLRRRRSAPPVNLGWVGSVALQLFRLSSFRIHEFIISLHRRFVDVLFYPLQCTVPCLHSRAVTSTVLASAFALHMLAHSPIRGDDQFPHACHNKVKFVDWHWPQARTYVWL